MWRVVLVGLAGLALLAGCRSNSAKEGTPAASASAAEAAPKLPLAGELSLHVVARGKTLFVLDVLENGGLVYPFGDAPRAALLVGAGKVQPLEGAFAGVEVPEEWSFGPVEGHWPDFTLLTVAHRGFRGAAREARVLKKTDAEWKPHPGKLAERGTFVVLPPIGERRLILVDTNDGYRFVSSSGDGGKELPVLEPTVDGKRFVLTGASADASGRIFASGFVHAPQRGELESGGGANGGFAVVQWFGPGETRARIERVGGASPVRVDDMSGSGVFSAGKLTFAPFGRSRSLGRFEGGRFVVEALPIAEQCSGIRDFTVAGDGSVWFGTTDDPSGQDVYLRRTPDGRYTRVPLPPGIDVRGIYAESSKVLWVIASRDEPGGVVGLVLHTASLGAPVTLDPPPAPKR